MKIMRYIFPSVLLALGFFLAACENGQTTLQTPTAEPVPKEKNPFPFYKSLEIKPGLVFEVLAWGKGTDSLGAYSILMTDSAKNNYKSISNERTGKMVDAWNMDLDVDGRPEIFMQLALANNENDLICYEFNQGQFNKISFPGLSSNLKKIYKGGDTFYIKDGDLYRTFKALGADEKTLEERKIKYTLRGNTFNAEEIKNP